MTLVQQLDYDHAPTLLPHESLQSLPTKRLREMAVRSTRAYRNWNTARPKKGFFYQNDTGGPEATRSSIIWLSEAEYDHGVILSMLVPGGKYLVFQAGDGRFHCYNTETEENICTYPGAPPDEEIVEAMDCFIQGGECELILAYAAFKGNVERQ